MHVLHARAAKKGRRTGLPRQAESQFETLFLLGVETQTNFNFRLASICLTYPQSKTDYYTTSKRSLHEVFEAWMEWVEGIAAPKRILIVESEKFADFIRNHAFKDSFQLLVEQVGLFG